MRPQLGESTGSFDERSAEGSVVVGCVGGRERKREMVIEYLMQRKLYC